MKFEASNETQFRRIERFLKETHVGALIKHALVRLEDTDAKNLISVEFREHKTQINQNKLRTHRDSTDLESTEISGSLAVTLDVLDRIDMRSRNQGTRFVVLFIPSKEIVFYDHVHRSRYEIPSEYHEATGNERKVKSVIKQALDEKGIKYVDGLESVRHAVFEQGAVVYTRNKDGHPLSPGYKAYADAIYNE